MRLTRGYYGNVRFVVIYIHTLIFRVYAFLCEKWMVRFVVDMQAEQQITEKSAKQANICEGKVSVKAPFFS